MDEFSPLAPSRRRFSPLAALYAGILAVILCLGSGCGDYTLFGDEDGPCDPDPCANRDNAVVGSCEASGGSDFSCRCEDPYFWKDDGNRCEDPCDPDPCAGIDNAQAGTCTGVDADDFTCDCDTGHTWDPGSHSCTAEAVGTCDDLKDCLGECQGINDTACMSICNWKWTGCECTLDWNALLSACGFACFNQCADAASKACWDCVLDCGFDDQCQ